MLPTTRATHLLGGSVIVAMSSAMVVLYLCCHACCWKLADVTGLWTAALQVLRPDCCITPQVLSITEVVDRLCAWMHQNQCCTTGSLSILRQVC